MNEIWEREEIALVSNVCTLEHSGDCAELRLMVDIKTQKKEAESMLSVRTQDETGFRKRTQWSPSKSWLHLLKQHTDIYIETKQRPGSWPRMLANPAASSLHHFTVCVCVCVCGCDCVCVCLLSDLAVPSFCHLCLHKTVLLGVMYERILFLCVSMAQFEKL